MQIPKSIKINYGAISCLSMAIVTMLTCSLTYAESSSKTNVSVNVLPGCTVTSRNNEHISSISNGTHDEIGTPTEVNVACNGNNLYSVYAVGYSNDEEGNNNLIGSANGNIATGTATEGSTSSWHFKLSTASDGLTIEPAYTTYTSIPNSSTLVAKRESSTTNTNDSFNATYAAYISKAQPADTYSGKVKYTIFDQGIYIPPAMQDFQCNSLDSGQYTTLIDARDDNIYTVAKLADGKCWMTDNLRLGDSKLTTKNPSRTLTTDDTDLQYGIYNLPESSYEGFDDDNAANIYVPDSALDYYNMEYGGYYTWIAATAGTGKDATYDGAQASGSICPKGWRLPKGSGQNNDDNEFALLIKSYGGTGDIAMDQTLSAKLFTPSLPGFVTSGSYEGNPPSSELVGGNWWSSTSIGGTGAYYLLLNKGGLISPIIYNFRRYGYSLRCIAQQ